MSTESDREYAQVVALAQAVRDMRAAVDSLEAARDAALRRYCERLEVNRVQLARACGLSRSRLYSILEPSETPDGPDVDAIERADALWDEAVSRWHEAGGEGTPDDYFPLDDVVAHV